MTKGHGATKNRSAVDPRRSVIRFGTGTKTEFIGGAFSPQAPPSSRASFGVVFLRSMFRNLLSCAAELKAEWRARITNYLLKVRNPDCIDELLVLCATRGGPNGLDMAIDILSKTDDLIVEYSWEYLRRDISSWTPDSERAYEPNDDLWYILLRSVARCKVEANARFEFIRCCAGAGSRGIREGVVEGLGDLATPDARELLENFAQQDPDSYIRKIADEALTDLES